METISRREAASLLLAGAAAAALPALGAESSPRIALPPPRKTGGMSLMEALSKRRSMREFSPRPLEPQALSNLLWAAYGINRASGDRTAPCWRHVQAIEVYAAMADGLWLYEPKEHALLARGSEDIRALTGVQDFVATAPLNLVYVAHGERMRDVSPEERRLYASVDAAVIAENAYLACAGEGLATVLRASLDPRKLAQAMRVDADAIITFAQSVGYPPA